ncbi:hypothetical protein PR048_004403 [Dryococelus australis]|uniref:Uncharacterized protein n=1 Tax=Dryococelus australis TaxID=614101 RepID=A0ABQ9I6F1_9NEOP|nr:hypothetical protein PR048_004403 [Dryococelus australis]
MRFTLWQMEEEAERMRQRSLGGVEGAATNQTHATQEIVRLKAELERLERQCSESLAQQQSRHSAECGSLRDQLQESENMRDTLQREVCLLYIFLFFK